MTHVRVFTLLSGALMALPAPAADPATGGVAAAVVGSTLGIGGEVAYRWNGQFGTRIAGYAFSYSDSGTESGINYDADLDLSSFGAYLDWYPFLHGLRVTAGWFAADNGIDVVGRPGQGGSYDIGGTTFTAAQVGTLSGNADLGSSAPYLGLGWQFGAGGKGFHVNLDAGVLFQDSPTVQLTSTGGTQSGNPQLTQALDSESRDLEDELDKLELYPVISLGLGYRF
jgi:hypothetical protein